MESKFILALVGIIINVTSQTFLKAGLGYREDGVQVVPAWAEKLGAKPLEINLLGGGLQQLQAFFTNIPVLIGVVGALCFYGVFATLISRAGLSFASAILTVCFVFISINSYLLFKEYIGGLKLVGLIVIVTGFILVSIGEHQATMKGLIE